MESDWEEHMKTIRRTLKEIVRKLRKRRAKRRRLPVWEDDEVGWWRRRRRSTMHRILELSAFPKITQVEGEEEEASEEVEEEDDEGGEELSNYEEECQKVGVGTDLMLEKLEAEKAMAKIRGDEDEDGGENLGVTD